MNIFRKPRSVMEEPSVSSDGSLPPTAPAGRRELSKDDVFFRQSKGMWNEYVGGLMEDRSHAQRMQFFAFGVAGIAVAGCVYLATQSHIEAVVIEVDKLGDAVVASRLGTQQIFENDRVTRAQLAHWVKAARTVYADVAAETQYLKDAYSMLPRTSQAYAKMNAYYKDHVPYERAATETVEVVINSALPISRDVWKVEWTETVSPRNGGAVSVKHWQVDLTISISLGKTIEEMTANPSGVYIMNYSWEPRL